MDTFGHTLSNTKALLLFDDQKFKTNLINSKYRIYSKVIDLNDDENLRIEFSSIQDDNEIKKLVLAIILFDLEIRWKKDAKLISLKLYSRFYENGLPDNLKDVKPFVE